MNVVTLLITLSFHSLVFARTDSTKDFPTKIPNWTFTSHRMDTGELRSCSAHGKFEDLEVGIGSPSDPKTLDISFRFVRGGAAPSPANPGDQRACGSDKKKAPAGSWRYNPNNSRNEFCDGKAWLKPIEEHFKKATLLLGGNEIAVDEDKSANFKMGLISNKPIFLAYTAWFQRVSGLEKKAASPGMAELRIDGLSYGPIMLGELHLDRVLAEFARCEQQKN